MGRDDPSVSFPPLRSVIALESAPAAVATLLADRWMAEAGAGPPSFRIRWRSVEEGGSGPGPQADEVRWDPGDGRGALANRCGRVRVEPRAAASTVELRPPALDRPECLEPLVEAALAHALAAGGECFLHAAALELRGRSLLVVGDSAAGKSTLAAAAVACGGRVISDDSLLLGLDGGRPLVRGARRNVWLRAGSAALLPALERRGLPTERIGGRIRLARRDAPAAFRISTRPDCLVLLARAGADEPGVVSRRLTQAEALAALLRGTSSLYVTDGSFSSGQGSLLELLTAFAQSLPAIEIAVGPELLDSTEKSLAVVLRALP